MQKIDLAADTIVAIWTRGRHRQKWHPPFGWTWVRCYQLDHSGDATNRRLLYVMPQGLRPVPPAPQPDAAQRSPAGSGTMRAGV